MSDDLDGQVSAYFEALAERVEPLDFGDLHPVVDPNDSDSSRPKGRGLMLVGAAMFVVVFIAVVAIARDGDAKDSIDKLVGASGSCSSIPVGLVPEPAATSTQPIEPEDVLYFEKSVMNMAGVHPPELVIASSGAVVAIHWDSEVTYRASTLAPETVDALRTCLTSADFQSLGNYEDGPGGQTDDGRFCAISDMSTQRLTAGPASGAPKAVDAYAIELPEGFGGPPGQDENTCYRFPKALSDLHATIAEIRDRVGATGIPTDPPAGDLDPGGDGQSTGN